MILGSFQPYFFPYLGHFDLINLVDKWNVSDMLQYINQGWINRNRILHPKSGWAYITVPLKSHPYDIRIKDVEIDQTQGWRERIIGQLMHYKKHAPYFSETIKLVEFCLEKETNSISILNTSILEKVCVNLDIRFDYQLESELSFNEDFESLSDRVCAKARLLGADEYLNPPGGAQLYDQEKFRNYGIKLTFQSYTKMIYPTGFYQFEPNLSIIDVMMWNSKDEIKRHLNNR